MARNKKNYLIPGENMDKMEQVKKMISKAKSELKRLHYKLRAKAAKRNWLLRVIINLRKKEHHLRKEIAKLDNEGYNINMEIKENQKTLNDAKRLGLW
jgi:septal ring factor EnvC (AmiA/AmiB activator)